MAGSAACICRCSEAGTCEYKDVPPLPPIDMIASFDQPQESHFRRVTPILMMLQQSVIHAVFHPTILVNGSGRMS